MICLIKYFCWKKRVVSLWLFRFIRAYNYSTRAIKWSLGLANAALLICPRQLYSFFPLYIVLCISDFVFVDWNRSKSIKINHNRTKSIITRNCVIDFYRFPIFVDWFESTTIDNDRILSTIRIIDKLRPDICHLVCPSDKLRLRYVFCLSTMNPWCLWDSFSCCNDFQEPVISTFEGQFLISEYRQFSKAGETVANILYNDSLYYLCLLKSQREAMVSWINLGFWETAHLPLP